jgi:UMF1 family MFS transporter
MGRVARLLERLSLTRRDTQSWVLYDWGDNAFATVTLAMVAPTYYTAEVVPEAQAGDVYWSLMLAASFAIIGIASPVLGAIADHVERSREFLAVFTGLGVVFTGSLFFTGEGDVVLVAVLFGLANIGFTGARLFYNSLLPGVSDEGEIDRVSTAGYAIGYLGGTAALVLSFGVPLAVGIPLDNVGELSRLALFVAACWWAIFSIPLFIYVDEPERDSDDEVAGNPVRGGYRRLYNTYREIRTYKIAFLFLIAFWFYTNGISAIITLSAAYAESTIGLAQTEILGALVLVNLIGVPCAFAFGQLAGRFSTKRALLGGIAVYTAIALGAVGVTRAWQFFLLAAGVGFVQGGTQALSRSLFGSLIPRHKSGEFFSFFSIVSGLASIAAPALFGIVGALTGSTRIAIGSLSVFFVVGMALLLRVYVETGREVARERTPDDLGDDVVGGAQARAGMD